MKICKPKETKESLKKENDEMSEMINKLQREIDNLKTEGAQAATPTEQYIDQATNTENIIKSVTNIIDRRRGQFYLSEPPGIFSDLKIVGDNQIVDIIKPYFVIKIGCNGEQTGRHPVHDKEFGGISRIIDSLITPVATAAEQRIKDILKNDKKLHSGKHEYKKTRDNELVIVRSQQEYEDIVRMAQDVVKEIEGSIRSDLDQLSEWNRKCERMEVLARQTKEMVDHVNRVKKEIEDKISKR